MTMFGAWFGLFGAATLGGILVLDISGVRPSPLRRLSRLPPSRQRWVLLLERLSLACWALWALIVSLQQLRVLPSQSGSMVAQHVIVVVGVAAVAGLFMIYQFGGGWRAVFEGTMVQAIRRARARDNKRMQVDALRAQARMMIQQRRWEEAERVLAEGLAVAQSMPDPQVEARLLEMWGCCTPRKVR